MKSRGFLLTLSLGLLFTTQGSQARPAMGKRMMRRPPPAVAPGDVHFRTSFAMLSAKPNMRAHRAVARVSTTGTSVAALDEGAIAIDSETGTLTLLDADAKVLDVRRVGSVAGLLAVDRVNKRVFVADRNGDRIQVSTYSSTLGKAESIKTDAEPYGLALSPDGKTLLVTTVAGRSLQAFDTESFKKRWSIEIGPEARAVSIAPDGKEAVVSFLGTAAIGRVTLDAARPRLRFEQLHASRTPTEALDTQTQLRERIPERHARNAFAATFVGDTALVAYQQSTPLAATRPGRESLGRYGGSAEGNPPLVHRLAFMPRGWNSPGRAHVRVQMPRALTYDAPRDSLYIADMATDTLYGLADTSMASIRNDMSLTVQAPSGKACGPDGVSIADGGDLWVHCAFEKKVVRIQLDRDSSSSMTPAKTMAWSPTLSKSRLSASAERGRNLFHKGNDSRLSTSGGMSCANCHPEARNDGLSWAIGGTKLQTPLLAGRMKGTHPFKWDGGDKDLHTSLMHTVIRLGGTGIRKEDATDLQAYLESLPAVRVKKVAAATLNPAQTRGKKLFSSAQLGCKKCHSGPTLSDGKSYEFSDDLAKVNTPSLIGLAASAPYYHDGSAATLRDLVLENGSVHGMGHLDSLAEEHVDDLVAYLETL